MKCPKCHGLGWSVQDVPFRTGRDNQEQDWDYEQAPCGYCKGKGYLTPEEVGLGKM